MVGAGGRGARAYGPYAIQHPEEVRFVAVAEPDDARRARFATAHDIPSERQFTSWQELAAQQRFGSAAVNATMDRMHVPSTLALLERGYDVLLEKPMAVTPWDCVRMVRAAEEQHRVLQICHVLRYAPFFQAIQQIVASGRLGGLINVQWNENLVYWHFAHSFIRGNWGNSERSGPMILTKCCHDLDLLIWMFGRPVRVSSSGGLQHFREDRVPAVIPDRCTDGCPIEDECPYYAPRIYIDRDPGQWARDAVSLDHSPSALRRALETGPYGRCVYRADNDVVDHQVVVLEYASGIHATLTMQGASHVEGRTVRLDGVRATLLANEARGELELHDHLAGSVETIRPNVSRGHGGGDAGVMRAFVSALTDNQSPATSAAESLDSHLLAFAAEESRVSGQPVDTAAYWSRLNAPAASRTVYA